jgi:hypothetical protein
MPGDIFADGLNACWAKFAGQRLVVAQKPEQKVLRSDEVRAELAGLVAREKDRAAGFFGEAFKHRSAPGVVRHEWYQNCPWRFPRKHASAEHLREGFARRRHSLPRVCRGAELS